MCWSSGRAYGPPRRASCPSRSRSLVCKRPIALLGLSETNTIGYYLCDVVDNALRHRQGALADVNDEEQFALGGHGDPHPGRRTFQALDSLCLTDLAVLDRAEQRKQLIQLYLLDLHVVQEVLRERPQLLRRFDQPLHYGIRIDLEHPPRAPDA